MISVVRTDTGDTAAGWGMNLQFECCTNMEARVTEVITEAIHPTASDFITHDAPSTERYFGASGNAHTSVGPGDTVLVQAAEFKDAKPTNVSVVSRNESTRRHLQTGCDADHVCRNCQGATNNFCLSCCSSSGWCGSSSAYCSSGGTSCEICGKRN
jgi:hypothetical protein